MDGECGRVSVPTGTADVLIVGVGLVAVVVVPLLLHADVSVLVGADVGLVAVSSLFCHAAV